MRHNLIFTILIVLSLCFFIAPTPVQATATSYNQLFGLGSHSPDANLEGWWPLMDNAANTAVTDYSGHGRNGTLQGGHNTSNVTTTGPNSWLTAGFLFALGDYFDLAVSDTVFLGTISIIERADITSGGDYRHFAGKHSGNGGTQNPFDFRTNSSGSALYLVRVNGGGVEYTGPSTTIGSWKSYGLGAPSAIEDVPDFYVDGSKTSGTNKAGSGTGAPTGSNANIRVGRRADGAVQMIGAISSVAIFSRKLSDSEFQEEENGPEPISLVAPVESGGEAIGQNFSCTSGTWGLGSPFSSGSNGTITYSYQWTRSDNSSGTNEADISGATSSTYTIISNDLKSTLDVASEPATMEVTTLLQILIAICRGRSLV